MGVINVLPLAVINKIAAGEVIERPASVVKELLENSLDAQATRVVIEVEDGGKKLIRVTDDGFGMGADDLGLVFSSHATSKLKTGEDLFFITTLGFRGEALASIGAVSQARVVSRLRGATEGAEVEDRGGAREAVRAKGAPEGTTVEVANLFFNVPARRKFLRSASTELAHIVELVSRVALANPAVGFRLVHNGREVVNLRGAENRRRRLGELYGRELADALFEVDAAQGPIRVGGFATPATHCRASARMQLTYVNGRFVRDRGISHAIAAGYEGLLPHGRYPVTLLFVQMDPREVDVNVHPTKIEVRFHEPERVHRAVVNAVRGALGRGAVERVIEPERVPWAGGEEEAATRSAAAGGQAAGGLRPRASASAATPPPATPFDRTAERMERPHARPEASAAKQTALGGEAAAAVPRRFFQLRDSYIVVEEADGIFIIDQHALHERVLFDEIRERLGKAKLESQRLLLPAVVSLSRAETALLVAEQEGLSRLGFDIAGFGPDSVAVNAMPVVLGGCAPEPILHEVLAELAGDVREGPAEARQLALAKLVACKAAVKAGERLTESEMRSLLEKAGSVRGADTCPHGRPAHIFLPFADLERQFKRTPTR